MIQTFVVLLAAVGIIVVIMLLIKKITMKRMENRATVNLNVITKITLQPKNHLFVVRAANKLLVLGVTDNSINILTELEPDFEKTITDKPNDPNVTDVILNKVINSKLKPDPIINNADLSFKNFIKSSIGLNK
ncbi:MAG: flagellar biosynthetic protein FliO [Bacteroidetes bacterium]|nr:flagellar biosynthetic protein FliO [Bacteroidota bacterium]